MAERVPDAVREAVWERDMGRCVRCGAPGQEFAHRRTRGVGGEHRHCPCNAWCACTACHRWQHAHPTEAMRLGLALSSFCDLPSSVPIKSWMGWMLFDDDGVARFHEPV